jgi:hypothetical protein
LIGRYGKYHGIRTNYLRIDNWQLNIFGPIIFRKQRYNIVLDYVVTIEYGWYSKISGVASLPRCFFYQGSSSKEKAFRTDNQGMAPSQNEVYPQRITMKEWGPIIYLYGSVSKPCTPVVHIKIAGKWMFIPLKIVLIGIDPYPYHRILSSFSKKSHENSDPSTGRRRRPGMDGRCGCWSAGGDWISPGFHEDFMGFILEIMGFNSEWMEFHGIS